MSNTPSLLGCPFCGAPASGYPIEAHQHSSFLKNIVGVPDHGGSYVIEGNCACGSGLIGETEAEVTERWNRRTPQPVVREPLGNKELQAISLEYSASEDECTGFRDGWRFAEKHYGITQKGGQHER